jgi:hypothetical protein
MGCLASPASAYVLRMQPLAAGLQGAIMLQQNPALQVFMYLKDLYVTWKFRQLIAKAKQPTSPSARPSALLSA